MKHIIDRIRCSLKLQLSLVFMALTILIILVSQFFTSFFMERFFISQNKRQLEAVYDMVKELLNYTVESPNCRNVIINEKGNDLYIDLVKICSANRISVYLFTSSGSIVVFTGESLEEKEADRMFDRIFKSSYKKRLIIKQNDDYIIQRYNNHSSGSSYMELISKPESNDKFILRTDLKAIKRHVLLSIQFARYSLLMIVPLSFLLIWFLTRAITRPVIKLTQISEKMINLDFDAKFDIRSSNEIGVLGANVNKLSQVLENTISELKSLNLSLREDVQQKEENERKMSEFVAAVSHDLKTPLALIQGYAEGLKEFINDDAESREFYCDVIMDEANKMNGMIKQLINLNYLEVDSEKLHMQRIDMVSLLRNISNQYEYALQQREISLKIVVSDDVKCAWGDELKIEEVLNNYVTNAIDHVKGVDNEDGVIVITLKKNNDKFRFEIFNTGDLIPEQDLERLWDKFFKVDRARNRQFGGSGIGLSIVKNIMTRHNQAYGVENYKNGVMFYFELDLA